MEVSKLSENVNYEVKYSFNIRFGIKFENRSVFSQPDDK